MPPHRLVGEMEEKKNREVLATIGRALLTHEEEIGRAWAYEYRRTHPENWLIRPGENVTPEEVARSQAHKFLISLRDGDRSAHLQDMAQLGRRAAEGGLTFQRLSMLIHYMEKGYLPFLYQAFKDSAFLAEALVTLDHFMHLTIATATTAYYEHVRSKLSEEIATGKVLQKALLPKEAPNLPGLEIGLVYASSTEDALVGGDIYDLVELDEDTVGILIGDVIGKGIKAAATAMMVKFMFRGYAYEDPEPISVLRRLNSSLLRSLEPDEFVTLLYGVYRPKSGTFRFANSGHPLPLYLKCGGASPTWLDGEGQALGLTSKFDLDECTISLEKGDVVLLYTDGLIEARDSEGQHFGESRVAHFVHAHEKLPAQDLAEGLFVAYSEFSGHQLSDDLAVVVLRRT